jgi:catalase (peroxidase I)
MPGAKVSARETRDLFLNRLGMNLEETVAIVGGGHTVAVLVAANNPDMSDLKTGPFDG